MQGDLSVVSRIFIRFNNSTLFPGRIVPVVSSRWGRPRRVFLYNTSRFQIQRRDASKFHGRCVLFIQPNISTISSMFFRFNNFVFIPATYCVHVRRVGGGGLANVTSVVGAGWCCPHVEGNRASKSRNTLPCCPPMAWLRPKPTVKPLCFSALAPVVGGF